MQVFQKLITLARGGARQSAQVLLDANALTVFEQEIVDVEAAVRDRKRVLSEMIAARKQIEREMASVRQLVAKRETQARRLLEEGREENLVEDIAADIAQQEAVLVSLTKQQRDLQLRSDKMTQALDQALQALSRHRRDLRVAKAQQVRASLLAKANHLPEQLTELEATREHVIGLQTSDSEREEAWQEMEGSLASASIDTRINKAGCGEQEGRARDVLARLKESHSKGLDG